MISLPIYNQGGTVATVSYITSETYPFLITDTLTLSSEMPTGNNFTLGENRDTFSVTASLQGNHTLANTIAEHDVYDTDIYTFTPSLQGNHSLDVVRVDHDVYDTDTYTFTPSLQGNHSLDVVRVDHDVYDTDTFTLTPSLQGNHTLSS